MYLTKDQCEKFNKDQSRNPLTGYKIKYGKGLYKKIQKFCDDNPLSNKNITKNYKMKNNIKNSNEKKENITKKNLSNDKSNDIYYDAKNSNEKKENVMKKNILKNLSNNKTNNTYYNAKNINEIKENVTQKSILKNLPSIPNDILNNNTYYNTKNINEKKNILKLYKKEDPIQLSIYKKQSFKESEIPILSTITIDDFYKKINDERFIKSYKNELIKYLYYKETNLLRFKLKNDINLLSENIIEELIKKVKEQYKLVNSEWGSDTIKKNLLDCFENKTYGIMSMKGRSEIIVKFLGLIYAFSNNYKIFTGHINFTILGKIGTGRKSLVNIISNFLNKGFITLTDSIYNSNKNVSYDQQICKSLTGIFLINTDRICFNKEMDILLINGIENSINDLQGLLVTIVISNNKRKLTDCLARNEWILKMFPYNYILNDYNISHLIEILIYKLQQNISVNPSTRDLISSALRAINKKYPQILKYQTYDIIEIANNIFRYIYMSPNVIWNTTHENNKDIVLQSFSDFLSKNGLDIKIIS